MNKEDLKSIQEYERKSLSKIMRATFPDKQTKGTENPYDDRPIPDETRDAFDYEDDRLTNDPEFQGKHID